MPTIRYASFGDISTGTLRSEDLLPAFANELAYQLDRQQHRFKRAPRRALIREAATLIRTDNFDSEDAANCVNDLQDALGEFAPPYGYFGTTEGDGASFGFYVSASAIEEFDGLKVSDLSEVPAGYRGEFMIVNDHGNVSLYTKNSRRETLIWSVV